MSELCYDRLGEPTDSSGSCQAVGEDAERRGLFSTGLSSVGRGALFHLYTSHPDILSVWSPSFSNFPVIPLMFGVVCPFDFFLALLMAS